MRAPGLVLRDEARVYEPRGGVRVSLRRARGRDSRLYIRRRGQAGVTRALSLVIAAQLIAGLLLDALGIFGVGTDFSIPKALGVALIVAGGALVVSY